MPSFQLWKERDAALKWHLSTSIAESKQLSRIERRVLLFLFAYYDREHVRIDYPGHQSFSHATPHPARAVAERPAVA